VCAGLALAAGACMCGDAGLSVRVEIAPRAVTTQCVKVFAAPPGAPEVGTAPIPRPQDKDVVAVAIYQGSQLPEAISVLARGYDDPDCTRLNEESVPNTVRFARGQLTGVTLHLNGSPCVGADAGTRCPNGGVCRTDQLCVDGGTEFDCLNNLDDDSDGRRDCLDPDCLDVTCVTANQCAVSPKCQPDGGCAGAPKACETPPTFCHQAPGTCAPATGQCSYAPDASIGCDDTNLCTTMDHCLLDAGCGGTAVACNTPPGVCFGPSTGCNPATGCLYPVLTGSGCDDGALCSSNDQCAADGGCQGTAYSCPPTECAQARACLGDGGCAVTLPRTGQPCTGGVCTDGGSCLTFPYPPSNFSPVAIADAGIGGDVVLSCNAWFNSTDGGRSWCSGQPLPVVTVAAQDGGPDAVVLAMSELTVSGSLTLVGSRPVILAVWGDVNISGTLSARSAIGVDAGPGSGAPAQCSSGQDGTSTASGGVGSGGGGGGYGATGGNAGDLTGSGGVAGGNGGGSNGNASIIPLRGGCHGGEGGRPNDTSATGGQRGSGGGAVQVSAAGLLLVTGTVTASGAGGRGGREDVPGSSSEGGNGGGGGGSGGAVLLEGQDVFIASAARLTANGGGGGEGGDGNSGGNTGNPGGDGQTTAGTAATGGAGAVGCASDGASGGAIAAGAGSAGNIGYTSGGCATGGGGGGVGRVRVNRSRTCKVDAGVMSPSPTFGLPCP